MFSRRELSAFGHIDPLLEDIFGMGSPTVAQFGDGCIVLEFAAQQLINQLEATLDDEVVGVFETIA